MISIQRCVRFDLKFVKRDFVLMEITGFFLRYFKVSAARVLVISRSLWLSDWDRTAIDEKALGDFFPEYFSISVTLGQKVEIYSRLNMYVNFT